MVCVCSIGMLGQCPLAHRTVNASFTEQCCERVVLMELEARWLNSLNLQSCMIEYIAFLECVRPFGMFRRCHFALAHLRSPKMQLCFLVRPIDFFILRVVWSCFWSEYDNQQQIRPARWFLYAVASKNGSKFAERQKQKPMQRKYCKEGADVPQPPSCSSFFF